MRKTARRTGRPVPVRSSDAFRVALRLMIHAAAILSSSAASPAARSPVDDESSGWSTMAVVPESPVTGVTGCRGSGRPTANSPQSPWTSDGVTGVRHAQTSCRPQPIVQQQQQQQTNNRSKNRKCADETKTMEPKNERNRDVEEVKTVLKDEVIVCELENKPKAECSRPTTIVCSSSPPPTTLRVPKIATETVPLRAAIGRFVHGFRIVKSFEFRLAATIVFALFVVIVVVCRYWTLCTRRHVPFQALP